MPKKIDEAEVKKECPSCGLGVSLESKVCEFCGWDFEEEDEWILQIEKLERDLMQEKQKFEPGSVDERIQSTLHSPNVAMKEAAKPAPKTIAQPAPKEALSAPKRGRAAEVKKPVPPPEPAVQKPAPVKTTPPKPAVVKPPEPVVEKPAPTPKPPLPEPVVSKPQEPPIQRAVPPKPTPSQPVVAKAPEQAPVQTPTPNVRRVRVVKAAPAREAEETPAPKKKLVRKVKGRS